MKSLEKLKAVFEDIEISEDQQKALDEFFEEFYENVKNNVKQEVEEEFSESHTAGESEDLISKEEALEALRLQKEEFLEDADKAFEKAIEDVRKEVAEEYSEKFTSALEEMYSTIYERVQTDFAVSEEGSALDTIKKTIQPLIVNESNEHLVTKIQSLESKLQELNEEKTELSRKELINSLISDIDESDKETVVEFIEGAKSEDEIYERFNTVMSLIEKQKNSKVVTSEETEEQTAEEVVNEDETVTEDQLEAVFETATTDNVTNIANKKNPRLNKLESAIIDQVFNKRSFRSVSK